MLFQRISDEEALERIEFMIERLNCSEKDKYALIIAKNALKNKISKRDITSNE